MSIVEKDIENEKLEEYFLINISESIDCFKGVKNSYNFENDNYYIDKNELKKYLIKLGENKFSAEIDWSLYFNEIKKNVKIEIKDIENILSMINHELYDMAKFYLHEAKNNIRNYISQRPFGIDFSEKYPIFKPYFYKINNGDIALCNGYLIDQFSNSNEDFTISSNFYLFRRYFFPWKVIKLRHGFKKSENLYLWNYFKIYIKKMASIFNGFRIDNAICTTKELLAYLIYHARKANKNLWVFIELYANEKEEIQYIQKTGVNTMMKEIIFTNNLNDSAQFLYNLNQKNKNSMSSFKISENYLCQVYPKNLIFDLTHDNKSYFEMNKFSRILFNACSLAFSICSIGSTKGFDDFYEKKIDFSSEIKTYNLSKKISNSNNIDINLIEKMKKLFNFCEKSIKLYPNLQEIKLFLNNLKQKLFLKYPKFHSETQYNKYLVIQRSNKEMTRFYILFMRDPEFLYHNTYDRITLPGKIYSCKKCYYFDFQKIEKSENENINELSGNNGNIYEFNKIHNFINVEETENHSVITLNEIDLPLVFIVKTKISEMHNFKLMTLDLIIDKFNLKELSNDILQYILYGDVYEAKYHVPKVGDCRYAGFAGFLPFVEDYLIKNDILSPFFQNLFDGNWMIDYQLDRLDKRKNEYWLFFQDIKNYCNILKELPLIYKPKYFSKLILEISKNKK